VQHFITWAVFSFFTLLGLWGVDSGLSDWPTFIVCTLFLLALAAETTSSLNNLKKEREKSPEDQARALEREAREFSGGMKRVREFHKRDKDK
jgi:hypothetical protein